MKLKQFQKKNNKLKIIFFIILFFYFIDFTFSQPMPLGIDGYVYGLNGENADSSVKFSILNINNGFYIESNLRDNGYYSVAIKGNKGDKIILSAWTLYNGTKLNNVSYELIMNGVIHNFNLILNLSIPKKPNEKPIILSQPITTAYEDSLYSYQVYATDPDNNELSYSIQTSSNLSISINNSGFVFFIPSQKDVGFHNILISVSDGNLTASQEYLLEVININDPPLIISIPNTTIFTNKQYYYQVLVYDEDSNNFSYSLIEKPENMIISNTGLVSWIPNIPGIYNITIYNITIKVSDSLNYTTQTYSLYVINEPNNAPIITSFPNTTINQNNLFYYEINAYDSDGDNLSYSLINSPINMTINNNLITWQTTYKDIGLHNILLKVQDSKGSFAFQNFTLEVININDAPIIITEPITNAKIFNYYVYDVDAIDYDNDSLIYSLIEKPKFMYINKDTGKIIWVPFKKGNFKVIVQVSDGNSSAIQEFYINVIGNKGNYYIGQLNGFLDVENPDLVLRRISFSNFDLKANLLISEYKKNNLYYIKIEEIDENPNDTFESISGTLFLKIPKKYNDFSLYQNGKKLNSKLIKQDKDNFYYNVEITKLGVFYFYTTYNEIKTPKNNVVLTGKLNFLNSPITEGIEYEITNLNKNETKKGITSDKFNAYAETIPADYNDEVKISLTKDNSLLGEKKIKITGDVIRQDINLSMSKEEYFKLLNKNKLKNLLFNLLIFLTVVLFFIFIFYKKLKK